MKLNEQEVKAVSILEPLERYNYFVKRVADSELMYTLISDEGDWITSTLEDETLFPVWSAQEFAALSMTDEWKSCSIRSLTIEQFENEIIDEIEEHGWLMNVHGIGSRTGFVVTIDEFARDLSDEMQKYH